MVAFTSYKSNGTVNLDFLVECHLPLVHKLVRLLTWEARVEFILSMICSGQLVSFLIVCQASKEFSLCLPTSNEVVVVGVIVQI